MNDSRRSEPDFKAIALAEWEKHPEKFSYYLVGNPSTDFAITKAPYWAWRFPWQKPNGGWIIGRLIVWWSR